MYNEPPKSLLENIRHYAAISDCEDQFPEQEFRLVSDAGLLHIPIVDDKCQFEKDGTEKLVEVLKMLGSASLPVGRIYEGHINALHLINLYGSTEQKRKYFQQVRHNNSLFGVWNTEDQNGVKILETGKGKYKLQGSKTFCSGAGWIGSPVVTGKLVSAKQTGWQMCIIPSTQVALIKADASFWKPLGMRASASYKMDFSAVTLDESDLLGPVDSYYQEPNFSGGALRFAAVQLGGAYSVLEETVKLLKSFGRTDDAFQKARIAEMSYLIETGNLWINSAAIKNDRWAALPEKSSELIAYVNMTRTVINEVCLRCMQLSERSVGARGLMRPHALERIHRDLTTYLKQPAPDAALVSIGKFVMEQSDTSGLWKRA